MPQKNTTVTAAYFAVTPKDRSYVSAGSKDISGMALIAQVNILSIHEILHSSDKKAVSVMGVHRMVKNCSMAIILVSLSLSISSSLISRLLALFG